MKQERDEELAHGDLMARDGNIVTLGDGAQWWLNGAPWSRDAADAAITATRARTVRWQADAQ